ncbi:family 43 glycosylhydrolase [Hyalangium rubrum]|uniref:Family 43 glycosylhydrolase n=1 Tax=Hyalangium rubrum TaxID=3103134 RepID=A0ABU5HC30_9BACT|nr:family 43 glycosylhydrolase [Hyalangium sp. s54d21]MDY7231017.1 family 43 glycosylhydrolase [Hyalangium sp. s54d21]
MLALLATACADDQLVPPPGPPVPEPEPELTLVAKSYTNPLQISIPSGGQVENCPDPTVIRGQTEGDTAWYMFCTADPLNDEDRDNADAYKEHLIPILKSDDLVDWTYVGDALAERPSWARPDSDIWAPEVVYFSNKYYLYYTVPDVLEGGSAIGVATSDSPVGPWTHSAKPAVEPHESPCCGDSRRWVFDPEVIVDAKGDKYIYYGSYFGGISVRKLSADGLTSDPFSQVEVAVSNRYEAPSVIQHGGYYYLLASATDCCKGPLTGYSVFAGRSKDPWGPFVDRDGVRLTTNRVGGTPVLGLNGNKWVGPGHNTIVTDFGGQDWILYHAIDRQRPYLAPMPNGDLPPRRQALMDALDWVDGWPVARGGFGASDTEQPAPAAQPGQKSRYQLVVARQDEPGAAIPSATDEFSGLTVGTQWGWVRAPVGPFAGVSEGQLHLNTQNADLFEGNNSAAILWQPAPSGNYLVETKLHMNLPPTSCCFNFVQAGLLIHSDDDNYVKLVHFSNWETRQIAFAKELGPVVPDRYPRYGETFGGPAGETVWLRIARRTQGDEELYTAYSSLDGTLWSRAGTWTHKFGEDARIGLVSMSGTGFTASFDYVRVYTLKD